MGANPSTYGDVYSYGILLLEMVTEKRPSDDLFKDDLGLHQFSKMALPESVMDIVDKYGTGANPSKYEDLYSYGILLLEMVTGKRPYDDMFKDDLGLHQFAKMALPESVMNIIDCRLLSEEIEVIRHNRNYTRVSSMMHECLVSLVNIGVSCSAGSPKARKEFTDVIAELQKIRDFYLALTVVRNIPSFPSYKYGTGANPSTYGDVYSYGILLLEMVTGKRPSDDLFKDDLDLHQFAKMALPESVMDIVDRRLLSEEIEIIRHNRNNNRVNSMMHECLVSLVKIGVSCSVESPRARKEMKDVIAELQKVRDFYLAATIVRNV
ncbi:putative LRR receptor-like serine/threonine-protein kinase [Cinnamomum micranthum f. kanehirae]|uniref:Putative LRR receptor-like serine/threonine-protein kinase n=1 Tax=Cinnamomum micranthum f. kanehirae TaxID=337451 RepID=A0A443PKX5_9MAGN|nr:putative LRR receptor-like serine/threonine-protein kinase [Cinnamomum micranthum f. kanehirae]